MKNPLGKDQLADLASQGGFTVKELLNPNSSSFKLLDLSLDNIDDHQAAGLIGDNPKIMRRPLLSDGKQVVVGFNPEQYAALLK